MVEALPGDLRSIYEGDYYGADPASGVGYSEYAFTAEHSVSWAAALAGALRPSGGAALDIGCADGLLLHKLGPEFTRRAGVEMHPEMAAVSVARGFELLAHDIYDPAVQLQRGAFDLVTAIAVFEHVPEFARAVRIALDVSKPDGILLFEVPLMSSTYENDVWLSSSLEHLYYPTVEGLQHLFRRLGVELHGGEVHIRGYGSTFVGLTSPDADVARDAGAVFARVFSGDLAPVSPAEQRARVITRLLHAAHADPGAPLGLTALDATLDLTPATMLRIGRLWNSDLERREDAEGAVEELRNYLREVEAACEAAQARLILPKIRRAASRARSSSVVMSPRLMPVRREVGRVRRYLAPRRMQNAFELIRDRDFRTFRQRLRGELEPPDTSGLIDTIERGPRLAVVQEHWPDDLPLVSVVIPCFNYGLYVQEAVDSALGQTLRRLEVIVVDGGSDDEETVRALDRLEHLERVRVLRRGERHLVGDNRNFGLAAARGRYGYCLDADDRIDPIYLEMAAYLLEVHGYDLVSTAIQQFGLVQERFGVLRRPALQDVLADNHVTTAGVFRMSLFERSGGYHDTGIGAEHIYEDWKLWVRLAALGARIINIAGQPLFHYRVHGEHSLSRLTGIPDIAHQRRAIAEYNRDLVNRKSLRASREARELIYDVTQPFANLMQPRGEESATVLITLPYLIVGGAERLISAIATHLHKQGVRVVIVTTNPIETEFGDTSGWFADATAEIYHLPKLLDFGRWPTFLDFLIETKHVDVLWQAGSAFTYSQLPRLKITHPHLRVLDLLFNTIGHTKANRAHRELIDVHVVENAEVEQWLLDQGEAPDRIVRAESGVDLERYQPSMPRHRTAVLRVGFSGRLSPEKAPLGFLDIAERLEERRDIEFLMTGAGPLEEAVRRRLSAPTWRGRVRFLGVVEDIQAHLQSLDVLLLPSELDGRPVVVLEALALGLPVVASEVGALPELVVEGTTGFLCKPGDVVCFADRVSRLAGDRRLLDAMSEAARRFAEEHLDARTMLAAYESTILRLAGSDAVKPRQVRPATAARSPETAAGPDAGASGRRRRQG